MIKYFWSHYVFIRIICLNKAIFNVEKSRLLPVKATLLKGIIFAMFIGKKKIIVLIFAIILAGCSAKKEVLYSQDIQSAGEFAQKALVELSGGFDKTLSKKNSREYKENGFKVFKTSFFPRHGLSAVTESFDNYCAGIGGVIWMGLCSYDDDSKGYFILRTAIVGYVTGTPRVSVEVIEPDTASPKELVQRARVNGYVTKDEYRKIQLEKKEKAIREKEKIKNEAAILFAKKKQASVDTRIQVAVKGARICNIHPDKADLIGFTEDFSENGKVKVSVSNEIFWDNAENWYLCEISK